jgi:probable selenium-dependent hydroxylase accessory protein YqeC
VNLIHSLDLKPREIISLMGGGGKTTLMFALARELSEAGHKVITTTTTKILEPSQQETPETILLGESQKSKVKGQNWYDWLRRELDRYGHITLAQEKIPDNKLKGISAEIILELDRLKLAPYIIVEADGSRRHPLKAPNATEPVIPQNTTLVISVAGIEVLNLPLREDFVFRADLAAQLLGIPLESPMTAEAIAALMTHPNGIPKGSPVRARIIPFINKIDMNSCLQDARDLATKILNQHHPQIERVILGQANSPSDPVREIIR